MPRFVKRLLVAAVFLGQLVAVWALNRRAVPDAAASAVSPDVALGRYGLYLREDAKAAGLDFTHQSPQNLDPRLEHILPLVASMGASVSVADFDRDGNPDVFVVNGREGGRCKLFRNQGGGTFRDVAPSAGLADLNGPGVGSSQGAVWGDFDNDGYEDVLVYRWGRPDLYRNDQGKRFLRVENAGLPPRLNANSAVWLDYDCDGHLDLFLAGYWADDVDLWSLSSTRMMPESFEYATNGGRKFLLRNKGDGTFEDVTADVGIASTRWTLGVQAADLCGTGYPDLILANDYGVSEFLCNKAGKRFEEIGRQTEIGVKPKSGMNVTFGDAFNRGKFCLYVTNISEPGNLVQGNWLWVPRPHRPGEAPRYDDNATARGVALGGWSWGAQFGDLDNDGWLDLYLTNGYVSGDKASNYWYEYGLIAGGNKAIISDAKNWPRIGGRSLSGYQRKHLWLNRAGRFIDAAVPLGVGDVYDGRAVALADLSGRGVLDVLVANQNGPLLMYRNTVAAGRDWVQFDLEGGKGQGGKANRSAIGALVRVFWTSDGEARPREQVQVVSGGNGYASQNMRRLHFGLGAGAKIDRVVVEWPGGAKQTSKGMKVNEVHAIREGR